jgi:hypothetical protein
MAILRVKELAEAQKLGISDLHRLVLQANPDAKVSYPTVHRLWHNKAVGADFATLAALASALRVSVGDLFVPTVEGGPQRAEGGAQKSRVLDLPVLA